jgi:hypothetical protein
MKQQEEIPFSAVISENKFNFVCLQSKIFSTFKLLWREKVSCTAWRKARMRKIV